MRLQKDKIIKRAIEVLDRDGLDGVTLRRLAKELDVQPGAIYYYIPDKETLLSEMANTILEERFAGFDFENDQREWTVWLDMLGHELRAAMLAHREGGRVVAGSRIGDVGHILIKLFDLTVRILHKSGFDLSKAATISVTVTYFTFGFVIEEQAAPTETDATYEVQSFEKFAPILMTAMSDWIKTDYKMHFDTSMRMIINGARDELET